MKNLVWTVFGLALSAPSYAWDGGIEDMNTMNANMSGPVVRVVHSYPGMPRVWTDNQGFRYGAYVHKPHKHVKKKLKHRHKKHAYHNAKRYRVKQSGVCIAKCYCGAKH